MPIEAARLVVNVGADTGDAERSLQRFGMQVDGVASASTRMAQQTDAAAQGITRNYRVMTRSAADVHTSGKRASEGMTAVATAADRTSVATEGVTSRLRIMTRNASDVHGGALRASQGLTEAATAADRVSAAADTAAAGAKRAGDAADAAGKKASGAGKGFTLFGQSLEKVGASMMRTGAVMSAAITAPIVLMGKSALTSGIQFESAFAGVRKTVDATEQQFGVLREGIRDMARTIPATREEIAGVAEAAGQLGVKQQDLLKFTRVAVDMGVATNMASQDAAMAMARLANIMQIPMDQVDRMGAGIVHLGNNFAATESEITNMSLRIAGAGHTIGLTTGDILGLSAGLSSLGIRAEAGGSAISRTMITIANEVANAGEGLDLFAKVAGMSADQFARAWRESPNEALIAFIEGLGTARAEGENVFQMLEDLGLNEIRVRDLLLRSANAGDVLRDAVQQGNQAVRENVALTREAEQRYKTTASQLQILKNRITDVGVSLFDAFKPDIVSLVGKLADGAERLGAIVAGADRSLLAFGIGVAGVAAAVGPVLVGVGGLVALLGGPLTLGIAGVTLAVAGLTGGFVALYKGLGDIERASPATAAALRESLGITQDWTAEIGRMMPVVVAGFATAAQAVIGFTTVLRGGYGVLRNFGTGIELLFKQMDPTRIIAGLANTVAQLKAWVTGDSDELARLQQEYAQNITVNWKAAWDALNDDTPWKQIETGLTLLDDLDTTYTTLRDSIAAGSREMARFTEAADANGRTLESAGGRLTEFGSAGEHVSGIIDGLVSSLQESNSAAQNFADAQSAIDALLDGTSAAIGTWDQKLSGAKRALEMLDEKRKQHGSLNADEQSQYDTLTWAVARYSNGITDDLNPAYIAAETRSAEFVKRVDDLNASLADGRISQDEYNASMATLGEEARRALGPNGDLIASNEELAGIIGTLIEKFDTLLIKLGLIPPDATTNVTAPGLDAVTDGVDDLTNKWNNYPLEKGTAVSVAGDADARERFADLKASIDNIPRGFTITPTVNTAAFDAGISYIDRRIPHSPAQEGPLSVPPNWDWLFEGLAVAAERRSKESVEHVKGYLDAIKSGFAAAREGLSFATDAAAFRAGGGAMPDAGFVAQLRDASESMIAGVGDSASTVSKEFLEQANNWSNAVKTGWGAIKEAINVAQAVADARGLVAPADETVSQLKFASEHMVQSMGDSAAMMDAGFVANAMSYLEAVKAGWGALQAAADFGRNSARVSMPDDAVVSDLKFRSEHMVRSLGDSAAIMDGQFVGAAVSYAGAVKSGFEALSEAVGFARALSSARKLDLPSDEIISALKFKAEHLVRSLGDSAAVLDPRFIDDAATFAGAMKDGFGAIKDALDVARELAGASRERLDAPDALLDSLVDLGKRLVTRLDQASLLFSTQALDEAGGLAGAMKDTFGAVTDALKFAQDAQAVTLRGITVREDVLDYLPDLARGLVDRIIAARAELDDEGLNEAKGFAEAISSVFEAMNDALEFATGAGDKGLILNPDLIAKRSAMLVDTIELVATDLSASADRLVTEAPGILQNLETFSTTVAPGIKSVGDAVDGINRLREMSSLGAKQADVFAKNMGIVATAMENSIEPLRRIEASGVVADFSRIIGSIVDAIKKALDALGVKASGGVSAGGGGGGGTSSGIGTAGSGGDDDHEIILIGSQVIGNRVRETYRWADDPTPGNTWIRERDAVPVHLQVAMDGRVVAEVASQQMYAGQQLRAELV